MDPITALGRTIPVAVVPLKHERSACKRISGGQEIPHALLTANLQEYCMKQQGMTRNGFTDKPDAGGLAG
jgi:hypothetical protein